MTMKLNTKTIIIIVIIAALTVIVVRNCMTMPQTQTTPIVTPPSQVTAQQVDDGLDVDSVIVGAVVGAVAGSLVSQPRLTNPPPKQKTYKKPFRTERNNYTKKKVIDSKPSKKVGVIKSHKPAKKVSLTKSRSRRK